VSKRLELIAEELIAGPHTLFGAGLAQFALRLREAEAEHERKRVTPRSVLRVVPSTDPEMRA
jgi:hypothetical protein